MITKQNKLKYRFPLHMFENYKCIYKMNAKGILSGMLSKDRELLTEAVKDIKGFLLCFNLPQSQILTTSAKCS